MFSFPVTRLSALISSLVTLLSARALIRCTVAISNSTNVSVISRSRSQTSAANNSTVSSRRCVRMRDGASTAARARQAASTLGATSANNTGGNQIDRTASNLPISVIIDSDSHSPEPT